MIMKVLTICHYHPKKMHGGGSWVGYNLSKALSENHDIESIFLGGSNSVGINNPIEVFSDEDEYVIKLPGHLFSRSRLDDDVLIRVLQDFILKISPDVVHFHALDTFGLRFLHAISSLQYRKYIVIHTLHNYMPICQNNGWMMRPTSFELCYQASSDSCHKCYPKITPHEFDLHKELAKKYLLSADGLITPSIFSKTRYVEWGLPAKKVNVIPNGQPDQSPLPRRNNCNDGVLCLGYFGQIGVHKGLDVLLRAMLLLPLEIKKNRRITLDIFGSNLGVSQDSVPDYMVSLIPRGYPEFIFDALSALEGTAVFRGAYNYNELGGLMADIDWVVVPSTQWENQPLTIQEAFLHGRPVICSGIGGMAEMVQNGVNGLYAEPGNPQDLAKKIMYAYLNRESWVRFQNGINPPPRLRDTSSMHIEFYSKCIDEFREAK